MRLHSDNEKNDNRARPGFEPGTSRTLSENHTPRPTSQVEIQLSCPASGHGLGPALGKTGGLTRLDLWRSCSNELRCYLCVALSALDRDDSTIFVVCNSFGTTLSVIRHKLTMFGIDIMSKTEK